MGSGAAGRRPPAIMTSSITPSQIDTELEPLIKLLRPKLKRVLGGYGIPPHDADDLLQEVFLAALNRWDSIENKEAWMIGTLRNRCARSWRGGGGGGAEREKVFPMKMSCRPGWLVLGLAGALLLGGPVRGTVVAQGVPADEDFHYHWKLGNLLGTVLGLFLPREGDGDLAFKLQKDGHLRGELMITLPESHGGEYWRYGSEIDPRTLQPIRVWSSYQWRGRSKSEND